MLRARGLLTDHLMTTRRALPVGLFAYYITIYLSN
jgi:hypothetical protein